MPPPLKLAIVGGGPSAFYVASRLLQLLPRSQTQPGALGNALRVHMYDRLWTPHGLVRYGVAPDHPEVKNCTNKFDEVATQDPRFSFFGNTSISDAIQQSGKEKTYLSHTLPLELAQILQNYSHLLIATGSPLSKLHPTIFSPAASPQAGMELSPVSPLIASRVLPALSLVHWYTQHPSNQPSPPLETTRHVTIIGMGNVALDVARILLSSVDRLERGEPPEFGAKNASGEGEGAPSVGYDLPSPVLSLLRRSAVEHVSILGRRGPLEAAFTARELREMIGLDDVKMDTIPQEILQDARKGKVSRQQGRILQLLEKANAGNTTVPAKRSWSLQFYRSPINIRPAPPDASHGMKLELEVSHTKLEMVDSAPGTSIVAVPTGETSIIPTDMVVTSMGFEPEKGDVYDQLIDFIQIQGLLPHSEVYQPFSTRSGRIPTDSQGRVILPPSVSSTSVKETPAETQPILLKNIYASGWASMGARGVLAATMADAYGVAETIVRDYTASTESVELKEIAASSEPGNLTQEVIQVTSPSTESNLPPRPVTDAMLNLEAWKARDASVTPSSAEHADDLTKRSGAIEPSWSSSSSPFVVTYQDWKRIDEEEIRQGADLGKERERMTWEEVVKFLRA